MAEKHPLISPAEAKLVPYPFIWVNDDGTARELHISERRYLETPMSLMDRNRPYVKGSFHALDGRNRKSGFCLRSGVPSNVPVAAAPVTDPTPPKPKSRDELIAWMEKMSPDAIEMPDGSLVTFSPHETKAQHVAWVKEKWPDCEIIDTPDGRFEVRSLRKR